MCVSPGSKNTAQWKRCWASRGTEGIVFGEFPHLVFVCLIVPLFGERAPDGKHDLEACQYSGTSAQEPSLRAHAGNEGKAAQDRNGRAEGGLISLGHRFPWIR